MLAPAPPRYGRSSCSLNIVRHVLMLLFLAHLLSIFCEEVPAQEQDRSDTSASSASTAAPNISLGPRMNDPDQKSETFLSRLERNLVFKKEIVLGARYSDELEEVAGANEMNANSIGFDLLKKFTSKTGDFGTLNLQLRLVRRWNQLMVAPFTEGEDDTELEWHEAAFTFTKYFKGKANLKLGHFDVPYGLEQNIDTHGSLVQIMSMRNVGVKKDWGLSLGGQFPLFDYATALTLGSGMAPIEKGKNYLLSGRVGTPSTENFSIGLSGLYGEVIDSVAVMRGMTMQTEMKMTPIPKAMPMQMKVKKLCFGSERKPEDDRITRWRLAVDAQYWYGPLTFKGEVSIGQDENEDIVNAIGEVDWLSEDGRLELIGQVQSAWQDLITIKSGRKDFEFEDDTFTLVGFNYKITADVTFSLTYRHDFDVMPGMMRRKKDDIIAAQLYFYW